MNQSTKKAFYWTPRIAGILFILFISLFALDVFDGQMGFWDTALALLIHLVPSIVLAILVVIAWKREWFGAVVFIGWALWYIGFIRGQPWPAYALIAGLPTLIGLLFLAGWIWRKQIRKI